MNNATTTAFETLGVSIANLIEETPQIATDELSRFGAIHNSHEMHIYMRRQTPSWETP